MTKVLFCGDVHGYFDSMYEEAIKFNPDLIIQVGDTCITDNPVKVKQRLDRKQILTDILPYLRKEKKIPIPTYFARGNHEDFDFLEQYNNNCENLNYMHQGEILQINNTRIAFLGGNYSEKYFMKDKLSQTRRRHFNHIDFEKISKQDFDILVTHDGPKSKKLPKGVSVLTDLIKAKSPQFCIHGHFHNYYQTNIASTLVIGLDKINNPKTPCMYLLNL